jgi:predicted acyl esterase
MPGMAERRVWIRMADGVRLAATLYLPEQGPSRCTWWR